jgi:hypothetical protein
MSIRPEDVIKSNIQSDIVDKNYTTGKDVGDVLKDIIDTVPDFAGYSNSIIVTGDNSTRSTRAAAVQDAINKAGSLGRYYVVLPKDFIGYDENDVDFTGGGSFSGKIIKEGQKSDVWDVEAYGATPEENNSQISEMEACLEAAPQGSTIDLAPQGDKTYTLSTFRVNKSNITIVGQGKILGNANGQGIIRIGNNSKVSGVKVDDLEIDAGDNKVYCISVLDAVNTTITNCELYNTGVDSNRGFDPLAFSMPKGRNGNAKVINCEMYNSGRHGSTAISGEGITYRDCYIHDVDFMGIDHEHTSGNGSPKDVRVVDCDIVGWGRGLKKDWGTAPALSFKDADEIEAERIKVIGNKIDYDGNDAAGMEGTDGIFDLEVKDNYIRVKQGTSSIGAVSTESGNDNHIITNNNVNGSIAARPGSIVSDNIVINSDIVCSGSTGDKKLKVSDNDIRNGTVRLFISTGAIVKGNSIQNNGQACIQPNYEFNNRLNWDYDIIGNYLETDSTTPAFRPSSTDAASSTNTIQNVTFKNNTVVGARYGFRLNNSLHIHISDNTFRDIADQVLYLVGSEDLIISNNLIRDCTDPTSDAPSMLLPDTNTCAVVGNVIINTRSVSGTLYAGIRIEDEDNSSLNVVANNVVKGYNRPIRSPSGTKLSNNVTDSTLADDNIT